MTLESTAAMLQAERLRPVGDLSNIAELRLLFASFVVVSHAVQLSSAQGYDVIRLVMNSEVAVQGFFILSGFLVFGSYERLRDPVTFYRRRMVRIFPGYVVAVLLFLTLALVQARLLGNAVALGQIQPYLAANLSTLNFLWPSIDGVFSENAVRAINGALWSIKVELMFYACVPALFALFVRTSALAVAAVMVVAGVLWWPMLVVLGDLTGREIPEALRNQLPGQLHYFGLGLMLYAFSRGKVGLAALVALAAGAIALVAVLIDLRTAANMLGLVLVIGIGAAAQPLNSVFAKTDLSYGIYLCHFPIIQMMVAGGAGAWPFSVYLAAVIAFTVLYGMSSWRFIEKPALGLDRRWSR